MPPPSQSSTGDDVLDIWAIPPLVAPLATEKAKWGVGGATAPFPLGDVPVCPPDYVTPISMLSYVGTK